MTYPQAIKYLASLINYEKTSFWPYKKSLKLARIKDFLNLIGRPQEGLKCIHVAGTKGKGSTSAFIAYILQAAGFKTGLYTSPHLSSFRERIRILPEQNLKKSQRCDFAGMISRRKLASLTKKLKPAINRFNLNSPYGPLSFFEVYTALSLAYFKEKQVDFAVLETGLGGRLDATNVISPLVCAITPISFEHTDKLGGTLKEIAQEKAGIIKAQSTKHKARNLIVISAPQEKEALAVIRKRCRQKKAKLFEVAKDVVVKKNTSRGFSIHSPWGEYKNLRVKLLGAHQIINAALSVGIAGALNAYNYKISPQAIKRGLNNAVWPGRCEIVSRYPFVVLDGAQNAASSASIARTVKENFRYRRLILVLGISKDKDIAGICSRLYQISDLIILAQAASPRATNPAELAAYFIGKPVIKTDSVSRAIRLAENEAAKEDLILVTGSLFVVGEAREHYAKHKSN